MMRPQSEPKGIGVPTGATAGPRQQHCPGAMLRVLRAEYVAMRRDGQIWATGVEDIRAEGLSDARVFCRDDVETLRVPQGEDAEKRKVFALYASGLCRSCGEMERINRAGLASRVGR